MKYVIRSINREEPGWVATVTFVQSFWEAPSDAICGMHKSYTYFSDSGVIWRSTVNGQLAPRELNRKLEARQELAYWNERHEETVDV